MFILEVVIFSHVLLTILSAIKHGYLHKDRLMGFCCVPPEITFYYWLNCFPVTSVNNSLWKQFQPIIINTYQYLLNRFVFNSTIYCKCNKNNMIYVNCLLKKLHFIEHKELHK